MTNRALTTLAIRFAALLLFMKIFEEFGSYFYSVYYSVMVLYYEKHFHTTLEKFYFNGTFLIISNFVISGMLFFKAEWFASKLIKEDSEIKIGLSPEKLIKVILLTTGIIWLANVIYFLPYLYDFIQIKIAKANHEEFTKKVDFNPLYFILKTTIGLLFIFRVEEITVYLEKKMNRKEVKQKEDKSNDEL